MITKKQIEAIEALINSVDNGEDISQKDLDKIKKIISDLKVSISMKEINIDMIKLKKHKV